MIEELPVVAVILQLLGGVMGAATVLALPFLLVALFMANSARRKVVITPEQKQDAYAQGYRQGYEAMAQRTQARTMRVGGSVPPPPHQAYAARQPEHREEYHSPLTEVPAAVQPVSVVHLSKEEIEQQRKEKAEITKKRLVNSALYVGVSLIIIGFVVSVFTANVPSVLQFILLLFFAFLYYIIGAVVYRKLSFLRSVAWAFMATGMVTVPIVGALLYDLLYPVSRSLVWLGASIVTVLLYMHALYWVRRPFVLYAVSAAGLWVTLSFASSLELSAMWHFVAGFVYVILSTLVRGNMLGQKKSQYDTPLRYAEAGIAGVLALVAFSYRMPQAELSFVFFAASIYCIVAALVGGWGKDMQRVFITAGRLLIQISLVSGIYDLTKDTAVTVWTWMVVTAGQVLYSIWRERVRPGLDASLHTLWIVFGLASSMLANVYLYDTPVLAATVLISSLVVGILSALALMRLREWYYLFGIAVAAYFVGPSLLELAGVKENGNLFQLVWYGAMLAGCIAAAHYIRDTYATAKGYAMMYLTTIVGVVVFTTLWLLLGGGWWSALFGGVFIALMGAFSYAAKVREMLYVGLAYLVPASFTIGMGLYDVGVEGVSDTAGAYTVCMSFIVGSLLLGGSLWLGWRKDKDFMILTTDILLSVSILYTSIATFLPLGTWQIVALVAVLLLSVVIAMYRVVAQGSRRWAWGVYWLLLMMVLSVVLRMEWGASMQHAVASLVWVVGMMPVVAMLGRAKRMSFDAKRSFLLPGYSIAAVCLGLGFLLISGSVLAVLLLVSAIALFSLQIVHFAQYCSKKYPVYILALVIAVIAPLRAAMLMPDAWPLWLTFVIFSFGCFAGGWINSRYAEKTNEQSSATGWVIAGLTCATIAALISFGGDSMMKLLSFVQFVVLVFLGVMSLRAIIGYWSIAVLTLLVLSFAWNYGALALSLAGTVLLISIGVLVYRQERHRLEENKLKKKTK